MQIGEQADDLGIDPGFRPARGGFGAQRQYLIEGGIDAQLEGFAPQHLLQRARQVKFGERQDAALFGIDPVKLGVVMLARHGKTPSA